MPQTSEISKADKAKQKRMQQQLLNQQQMPAKAATQTKLAAQIPCQKKSRCSNTDCKPAKQTPVPKQIYIKPNGAGRSDAKEKQP
jgi:hypothetical protein